MLSLELINYGTRAFIKGIPLKCLQPKQCILVVVQESLKVKATLALLSLITHCSEFGTEKPLQIVKPFQGFLVIWHF